jgi:acetyl esterase/lipase
MTAVPPALPGTAQNKRLKESHEFTRLLLGKADMRVELFRENWLGGTGVAHNDPRVNLLYANLAGLPPINIYYGAHELLVGEALEFADRAKAASLDVSLHCVPAGQHLFLLGAGRVPETDAAIAEMGQWLRSKLAVTR